MNLDDELNRLFSDDRLSLISKPSFEQAVVDGARRRRRHRIAVSTAGGALVVVAVVFGGIALAGIGRPGALQPAAPTPFTSSAATTATGTAGPSTSGLPTVITKTITAIVQPPSGHRDPEQGTREAATPPGATVAFGPSAYRGLELGMTEQAALATGLITPNAQPVSSKGCRGYDYTGSPNEADHYSVLISPALGVVRIGARADAITPEGVAIGSPSARLASAYAHQSPHGGIGTVAASGGGHQYWFITARGTVTDMRLELPTQDCY